MIFPTGGNRERVHPPPPKNLLIPANLEKFHPSRLPTPPNVYPPTTKQQFSSYNPIKAPFLSVVIALTLFLF